MTVPILRTALATVNSAAGKLFAKECKIRFQVEFYQKHILVFVPNLSAAKRILKQKGDLLAQKCSEWGQSEVSLCWSKSENPIPIRASKKPSPSTSEEPASVEMPKIPRLEADFNELYYKENPIYITQLSDQTNLFANPAALAAQGKKPKDFLGQSACALNDEDELERRCQLIYEEGGLSEYSYSALRWYRDPETGFWRRKRMDFISNFRKVEFLGELCWLGEVLQATDTGKTVA